MLAVMEKSRRSVTLLTGARGWVLRHGRADATVLKTSIAQTVTRWRGRFRKIWSGIEFTSDRMIFLTTSRLLPSSYSRLT